MTITKEMIIQKMLDNQAMPPLFVWGTGFQDVLDGVPQGGLTEGQHGETHLTLDSAAIEYLELNSIPEGRDLHITMPSRIIDSRNHQVYP